MQVGLRQSWRIIIVEFTYFVYNFISLIPVTEMKNSIEWFTDLASKPYQEFVSIHGDYVYNQTNFDCESSLQYDTENGTCTIELPHYGDAQIAFDKETDPSRKSMILDYINIMRKHQGINSRGMPYNAPVYYIEKLPKITWEKLKEHKEKSPIKKKKTSDNTVVDIKPKPKPKTLKKKKTSDNTGINTILSHALNSKLPCSKKEECVSRATSSKFYISKAALVAIIKKDPELVSKVGAKYATMTKEQICDKLFII
jgi:hypothetical protein